MILTPDEIRLLLLKVNDGQSGYADDPVILKIQVKLSILLEATEKAAAGY
jgi:hypothetical protein